LSKINQHSHHAAEGDFFSGALKQGVGWSEIGTGRAEGVDFVTAASAPNIDLSVLDPPQVPVEGRWLINLAIDRFRRPKRGK
jgi:hypothetical protein